MNYERCCRLGEEKPIIELFQSVFQVLREWGLSEYSIQSYYYEGIRPIHVYYEDAGKETYDEIFTDYIVSDIKRRCDDGIVPDGIYKCARKVAALLKSNNDGGFVWRRRPSGAREKLTTTYYSELLDHYRRDERQMGLRTAVSIDTNVTYARHFFRWLEKRGKKTLEHISLKDVSDFLTYYGELRPATIGEMVGALRKLSAFIDRQNISSIDISPALTVRPAKRSKLMPVFNRSQANEVLSAVDRMIDPANIHIQVQISNVPRKKVPVKVVDYMSEAVLENLFKQPNLEKTNGRRDQFFMILMYDVAARCRELLDLKICDVDLGKNASVLLTRKGGKKQSVPVSEGVAAHFDEYLKWFHPQNERSNDDYVFYTIIHGAKQQMSPDAVAAFMKGYAGKCRAVCPETPTRVHPHMLRHSRAMHLYRSGMPLVLISEFLGHADVNTTRIYAWADTEMKRQAIRAASPDTNTSVNAIWQGDDKALIRNRIKFNNYRYKKRCGFIPSLF